MSILKRLRWFDLAVVAGGIFLIVFLQLQSEEEETAEVEAEIALALFSEVSQVQEIKDLASDDVNATDAWAEWSGTPEYYGAFASAPTGAFGWTTRYNSENAARRGALAFCGQWSDECELNAVSLPTDYAETDDVTMSGGSTSYYRSYQAAIGAKAYALSEVGISRFVHQHRTREEAEAEAMTNCSDAVADYVTDKPLPDWPCQIIRSAARELLSPIADEQ